MGTARSHDFVFSHMHGRWQLHTCTHCGCLKVIKEDGSTWFKSHGKIHLHALAHLETELPLCIRELQPVKQG